MTADPSDIPREVLRIRIEDAEPHVWDHETTITYRNLLSRDATRSTGLVQGIATLQTGDVEAAHWHDLSETVHVLEGHGRATLDGETFEMRPGDTFYVPPGRVHEWRSESGTLRFLYTFPADDFTQIAYHHVDRETAA